MLNCFKGFFETVLSRFRKRGRFFFVVVENVGGCLDTGKDSSSGTDVNIKDCSRFITDKTELSVFFCGIFGGF